MTFKIYERKDQSFKIGNPLTFYISHKYKTYKIFTGIHVKPGSWNQEFQVISASGKKQDPKARQKNAKLKDYSAQLEKLLGGHFNIKKVRKEYDQYLRGSREPDKNLITTPDD